MIRKLSIASLILALAAAAAAQTPAPRSYAVRLVKLPNGDYTVPLRQWSGSGMVGKVTLHPAGVKTIVNVQVFGFAGRAHNLTMHPGNECIASGATNATVLKPVFGGQSSRTIVSVPIGDFTSKNYIIEMRNASEQHQVQEACARI